MFPVFDETMRRLFRNMGCFGGRYILGCEDGAGCSIHAFGGVEIL